MILLLGVSSLSFFHPSTLPPRLAYVLPVSGFFHSPRRSTASLCGCLLILHSLNMCIAIRMPLSRIVLNEPIRTPYAINKAAPMASNILIRFSPLNVNANTMKQVAMIPIASRSIFKLISMLQFSCKIEKRSICNTDYTFKETGCKTHACDLSHTERRIKSEDIE